MTVELICPNCHFSREIPENKMPEGASWVTCPRCGERFEFTAEHRVQQTGKKREKGPRREGSPWEKRADLGLWQGIYQTSKDVIFSPETMFRGLTFQGGISEPLAFGLLVGSFGGMFGFFWQFLMASGLMYSLSLSVFDQFTMVLIFSITLVIIPILVTVGMFIYSGILYILLFIARGGANGYEATFRVVSYSMAAQAWGLIPFVGGWISVIWQIMVQIIGLREIHETSYLRVIIAFSIPLIVIFLLMAVVLFPFFIYFTRLCFGQP